MKARRRKPGSWGRRPLPAIALAAAASCGAPAPPSLRAAPPRDDAAFPVPPLSPPRYVLTEGAGVLLDPAASPSPDPRPEPALHEGLRLRLHGGIVLAAAPSPEPLRGFRSLPARLGGGFVLWSDARVYRAGDFLGDLTPIADVGAPGGARPYLASIVLRTERGLLELDPATLSLRRFGGAGIVDVAAADARRAARLDAAGRAHVTLDGGASWIDVLDARGVVTTAIEERGGAVALLDLSGAAALHVTSAGLVDGAPAARARVRDASPSIHLPPAPEPLDDAGSIRALASDAVALAAATGALLPGGRILVAREGRLAVLAAATARPLAEAAMLRVDERYAHCQPFRAVEHVLLACAHDAAHVLRLETKLATPALEATFPAIARAGAADPGASPRAAFFGDERGRLVYAGPCGSTPPGTWDFPAQGGDGALLREPSAADIEPAGDRAARVCVREGGGRWVERRLEGADAGRLYRWIPGRGGAVTALVLAGRGDPPRGEPTRAAVPGEEIRVVRVRAGDPALAGGVFPAFADPATSPRVVDTDFWEDDDGALRGWIHLPDGEITAPEAGGPLGGAPFEAGGPLGGAPFEAGGPLGGASSEAGGPLGGAPFDAVAPIDADDADDADGDATPLALSTRRGGRAAGVRIDALGEVTVFPLPEAVEHVVFGGRFALAATGGEAPAATFETTDGGRSWRAVEGPPARTLSPPYGEHSPFACSAIGCAMGEHGLVRLGWGGPAPSPPAAPPRLAPAVNPALRGPSPPLIDCRLDDDFPSFPPPAAAPAPRPPELPPAVSLRTPPSTPLGALRGDVLSAEVFPPFTGGASPRRLSIRAARGVPARASGGVAPLLLAPGAPSPVDLLLLPAGARARAGAAHPALLPFEHAGTITAAGELEGGDLLAFDAGKRALVLATEDGALPIARLAPSSDASGARLTLARRLDAPGFALVGYSVGSGDVFAGALDLARGHIGPLEPLGSLASLRESGAGACGGARPSYRFVAELPATLRVASQSGAPLLDQDLPATALLAGDRGALCVEAIELRIPAAVPADLGAMFGPTPSASLRGGGARLRCSLQPDRR